MLVIVKQYTHILMAPYNPPDAHYAHIALPEYSQLELYAIFGSGFKNLCHWTEQHRLKYVWYNSLANVLELWGSFDSLNSFARKKIISDINSKISNYYSYH